MAYIPRTHDEKSLWDLAVKAYCYVLHEDETISRRVMLSKNEIGKPIYHSACECYWEIDWDDAQLIFDATQQLCLKIRISTFRFHACLLVDSIDYRVQNKTFVQH